MEAQYQWLLVTLSLVIAFASASVALELTGRVKASRGGARTGWLFGGGCVMALGIWSTHVVGMLALELPVNVSYDVLLIGVALLIAGAFSTFSVWLVSGHTLTREHRMLGGFVMGGGIAVMFWVGTQAMRLRPPPEFDVSLLGVAALVAVAGSIVALSLALSLRDRLGLGAALGRSGAAMLMGGAIAGMHYIGTAALQIDADSISAANGQASPGTILTLGSMADTTLAAGIGCLVLVLILGTLILSIFDAGSAKRIAALADSLQSTNAKLEKEVRVRTALTERLRQSNTDLERFAYVASHDLQAPLRTVRSMAQLLARAHSEALSSDGRDLLGEITTGAQHMQKLIDALLGLSRAKSGETEHAWFSLDDAVADALQHLGAQIDERGAKVRYDSLPMVRGDRVLMTQLVQNLVSNGIKFQPGAAPQVEIVSEAAGAGVRLGFIDHGIGIAAEQRSQIFEVFRRLHTAQEFEGTGIGLALVRKICDLHDMAVDVQSEPGQGTTFQVTIPPDRVRRRTKG